MGIKPRILIMGLGNELMTDDGVGVHAVRELSKAPPDGVGVAEVGTSILRAPHLLEEADIIIAIDAVEAGGEPGDIYQFDLSDADIQERRVSLHDLGLIGALRLMPEEKRPRVFILGVEPATIDYGMALSATVQSALPRVAEAARALALSLL